MSERQMAKDILKIFGMFDAEQKIVDAVIPESLGAGFARIIPHYELETRFVSGLCPYKKLEPPLTEPEFAFKLVRAGATRVHIYAHCSGCNEDCRYIKEKYIPEVIKVTATHGLESSGTQKKPWKENTFEQVVLF